MTRNLKEQYNNPLNGLCKKIIASTLAALSLTTTVAVASEPVDWYTHADKLKFSGLTYLGYTHTDFKDENLKDTNKFEMRRAYVQIKAYLLEDPKSYFRVTLDMEHDDSDKNTGDYNVRFKYAYLFLNEILPYTGVEVGIVHRPWIDYEEHNSWFYRDTHWVFTEASNAAKLSNSADLGFNLKTNLAYFSSEVGVFNGEGYHDNSDGAGVSFEWRATGHILGKHKKDAQNTETYLDASFFGQYNLSNHKYQDFAGKTTSEYVLDDTGTPVLKTSKVKENQDLVWGGLHSVFNMPSFMLAAQYIYSKDTMDGQDTTGNDYVYNKAGQGFNTHAVVRFGGEKQFRVVGRFDTWTPEEKYGVANDETLTKNTYFGGFVWEQSKNVQWVANALIYDNEVAADGSTASGAKAESTAYMLTTQITF